MSLPCTPTPAEWAKFAKMGDINMDGYINQEDVDLLEAAWLSTPSSPNWNPAADLNGDGIVNAKDLAILASNYGKNICTALVIPDQQKRKAAYIVAGVITVAAAFGIGYYALKRAR